MLEYKGYVGHAEYDAEAHAFHGEVLDTRDVITFQGDTVNDLERAFRESIDDYLEFCSECGEDPEKPFSGRLTLRLSPELHRRVYVQAKEQDQSLNQWISENLEDQLTSR
jgi:predicted HicB family RNase H-like nuclease